MTLPTFRYHPDPLATESIAPSDMTCSCCKRARGYIYAGPIHAAGDYDVCPWCIADGSAHQTLDVSFTDGYGVADGGDWSPVSDEVLDEVIHRTPGFLAWQEEKWWTHCNDAAQFLGRVGHKELKALGADVVAGLRAAIAPADDEDWEELLTSFHKDGSCTAYLFRCSKCGEFGGYYDLN